MKLDHVEDLGNKKIVGSIMDNKNDYPGRFIIGELFYDKVKKYMLLRPEGDFTDRFFIHFQNNKCTRQPIGRHKIGEIPSLIANYLELPNAAKYTGHCYRRTSANLLVESGANSQMLKQFGRWRSDIVAQGYIEDSLFNKELLYQAVVHGANTTINNRPSTMLQNVFQPSTSAASVPNTQVMIYPSTSTASNPPEELNNIIPDDLNVDGFDFSEDFSLNNLNQTTSELKNLIQG